MENHIFYIGKSTINDHFQFGQCVGKASYKAPMTGNGKFIPPIFLW